MQSTTSVGEEAVSRRMSREQALRVSSGKAFEAEETASAQAPRQGAFKDQPGSQWGRSTVTEGQVMGPENAGFCGLVRR